MTPINVQTAQKTTTDLVVRWVGFGFSIMGAAMTIGRVPVEITTRMLHHDAHHAARANVPETSTVAS
jgi:hypothetical protein